MIRGILIGLALFGLLIIGSCSFLGYGTMAVLDKAAEVAREERLNPAPKTEYQAVVDQAVADAEFYQNERDYRGATDEDYSDFGEPTVDIEKE